MVYYIDHLQGESHVICTKPPFLTMLSCMLHGCIIGHRIYKSVDLQSLREERRLRVFENRVLRRVFGPRRD